MHISARTQSRRQETLPASPRPQSQPRRQATSALGQVPFCDCLGACDCAIINDLHHYLPYKMCG